MKIKNKKTSQIQKKTKKKKNSNKKKLKKQKKPINLQEKLKYKLGNLLKLYWRFRNNKTKCMK